MRIIHLPSRDQASTSESWRAELEAALDGAAAGAVADSWRVLREDVRSFAPPIAPDFERELRARIAEHGERRRPPEVSRSGVQESGVAESMLAPRASAKQDASARAGGQLRRLLHRLRRRGRFAYGAIVVATCVAAGAIAIATSWHPGTHREVGPASAGQAAPGASGHAEQLGTSEGPRGVKGASSAAGASSASPAAKSPAQSAAAQPLAQSFNGAIPTPGRVQQVAASITLAATASDVQQTADRVGGLAVSVGGFVQSSHVQVQQGGTSEASLMLRVPSAKLNSTLGSLAQLAAVRAETQSLQDITGTYDAAQRRLADSTAERKALLRALAAASTQGQIESLHERLSQARSAIAEARSTLQAVSQRASTAEVEVSVVGDSRAGGEGFTLSRGLHDAGRVLAVTLAGLLIAAAILVPLALLLGVLVTGRRAWHRRQRERALDAP
jgi:hypothetical protein